MDPAAEVFAKVDPGPPLRLRLSAGSGPARDYRLADAASHQAWLDLFDAVARAFGTRRPLARQAAPALGDASPLRPVLVHPVDPRILYGYGDPCVVQVGVRDYRLLVTSNDAPDAFPILASNDLEHWRMSGFVFPAGAGPGWALTGAEISDFWAPELHRVGHEWWVCFTARERDRSLSIGMARAPSPDGPFVPDPEPLVTGGVIDSHILQDADGGAWLVWKQDANDRWPRALAALLSVRPGLAPQLFQGEDLLTARLQMALWPWTRALEPMPQFFVLQTLVEAVGEDLDGFEARLTQALADGAGGDASTAREILAQLRTRILAQRLSPDGRALQGEPAVILQNDLAWEGHLIEGVWITPADGRYHLLYAGNDFSTSRYGIGAAVADRPAGPYRKQGRPMLSSTGAWWGPGHPSVARAPDGGWRIFLHAFKPPNAGYKAFRALLTAPLGLTVDGPQPG